MEVYAALLGYEKDNFYSLVFGEKKDVLNEVERNVNNLKKEEKDNNPIRFVIHGNSPKKNLRSLTEDFSNRFKIKPTRIDNRWASENSARICYHNLDNKSVIKLEDSIIKYLRK